MDLGDGKSLMSLSNGISIGYQYQRIPKIPKTRKMPSRARVTSGSSPIMEDKVKKKVRTKATGGQSIDEIRA